MTDAKSRISPFSDLHTFLTPELSMVSGPNHEQKCVIESAWSGLSFAQSIF